MPIRADLLPLYPGGSIRSKAWRAIRARILARAGGRCERCKVPDRALISRGEGSDAGTYWLDDGEVFDAETGEFVGFRRLSEYAGRPVLVVLTVAHLAHDPSRSEDEDLAALCQRCHLAHDRILHATNARRTREARIGQGALDV